MVGLALLGYGVVGSGVAELLQKNAAHIEKKAGGKIGLRHILDIRDLSRTPYADLATQDFSQIENDPDVQVIVECIGGVGTALDYVSRALRAGKHVITSNKELVAEHGAELLAMAKERNLNFLFEGSVGGGIPVLRPLAQCLAANQLYEIVGILNGTSNYILTRMLHQSASFDEALREAKSYGYAESNPVDDVSGRDACRKICVLASLASGRHVYPAQVDTEGITQIGGSDMRFAQRNGYRVKLLGRAIFREPAVCNVIYVAPHLVPEDHPLAGVHDVFNAVWIHGDTVGEVMFYGRGAGREPTASAIAADIIDTAKHMTARKWLGWDPSDSRERLSPVELPSVWYVRTAQGGQLTEPMTARKYDAWARTLPKEPEYRMRVL
ncbi:MAG: homoserine dehydrogenase [Oscillospiraceae bacterium]|nr:homoserine dehydrogenase [Oscillospiraceae bacterium]